MSVRSEKVASLIKEELSTIIQRNFSMAEYGFITVTEVRMSADLRIAKVYISIYGNEAKKNKSFSLLKSHKPSIRLMLGRVIRLRFTPEINFYLDESIDRVFRIERIIQKIHEKDV